MHLPFVESFSLEVQNKDISIQNKKAISLQEFAQVQNKDIISFSKCISLIDHNLKERGQCYLQCQFAFELTHYEPPKDPTQPSDSVLAFS